MSFSDCTANLKSPSSRPTVPNAPLPVINPVNVAVDPDFSESSENLDQETLLNCLLMIEKRLEKLENYLNLQTIDESDEVLD